MELHPRFKGISVIHMNKTQPPSIFIRGSQNPLPDSMDVLDFNSVPILKDKQIRTLSEALEANEGSMPPDRIKSTLLNVLERDTLDFSPLLKGEEGAEFKKVFKEKFDENFELLKEIIKTGKIVFVPSDSQLHKDNNVFVSITKT